MGELEENNEVGIKSLFSQGMSSASVDEIDDEVEAENIRKVEAALFVSGKFLSISDLVALSDVNPILLKKILFIYKYMLIFNVVKLNKIIFLLQKKKLSK